MNDAKTRELLKEIKAKGLFATTRRLQMERRAVMPQGFYFKNNQTTGSRLNPLGTFINSQNRPERLKNSDPEIHRNSRPVERPLLITTISAEDEPEVELTEDDTTELSLAVAPITAGSDTESEIGPEDGDEEEGVSEGVETDGVSDAE